MKKEIALWLRVAHPIVLMVGLWMVFDHHRTAALVLLIASMGILLSAITLEHQQ